MTGRIIKGIAGFYYVYARDGYIYECRARGIFRKDGQKPLVGDSVEIVILDESEREGNLVKMLPRSNSLIRPAVANVDQALILFAVRSPRPDFLLLDRFLVMMEREDVPPIICINKCDLASDEDLDEIRDRYLSCGYPLFFISVETGEGIPELRKLLEGKITVLAGPSGAGKSSFTNAVSSDIQMETGEISRKLKRGRHTTRHSQLIPLGEDSFLVDTPGFTSLYLTEMAEEDLRMCFPEYLPYEGKCRFNGCSHTHEPDCAVKEAISQGKLSKERWQDYCQLLEEIKSQKRY